MVVGFTAGHAGRLAGEALTVFSEKSIDAGRAEVFSVAGGTVFGAGLTGGSIIQIKPEFTFLAYAETTVLTSSTVLPSGTHLTGGRPRTASQGIAIGTGGAGAATVARGIGVA